MTTATTGPVKASTASTIQCATCSCCLALSRHVCGLLICEGCWFDHDGMGCQKVVEEQKERHEKEGRKR